MVRPHRFTWLFPATDPQRRRDRGRRRSLAAHVGPLRTEPLEERRLLAITVDTLVDELDGSIIDGDISLRDAIAAATSGETINFAVAGTIDLTIGELLIDKDLTIEGPGANLLTIDAGDGVDNVFGTADGFRVFRVDDSNNGAHIDVSIRGLTLTGGDTAGGDGAGILSRENLTLEGSVITANSSKDAGGGLTILNFNNFGATTIIDSTISGNHGDGGGGIYALNIDGVLIITGSTIADNVSTAGGGGLRIESLGGATTITNSTITGNVAQDQGGGVDSHPDVGGSVRIEHSTITDNVTDSDNNGTGTGGGIYAEGPFATILDHTIVAGNRRYFPRDDVAGPVVTSYSLVGDDTGATITDFGGSLIGTGAAPIDPLLAPLADNGGITQTRALAFGSPAIDAGNPAFVGPPAFDQRSAPYVRDFGAAIDIGAYERQDSGGPLALVVDTLVDENDGDFSLGDFSLREALILANGNAGVADTITFDAALDGGTIVLTLGQLLADDSVLIDASALTGGLTVDASGNDPTPGVRLFDGSRVLDVDDGSDLHNIDVEIRGLTLSGGDVSGDSGGIQSFENLTLRASTISDNSSNDEGGGLALHINSTGTTTIVDSTISGNYGDDGGGVYARNTGGTLTISGTTISGNTADGIGAGIQVDTSGGGTTTITSSTISGNSVQHTGGGVGSYLNDGGTFTISHSTITGNVADSDNNMSGDGGGIDSAGTIAIVLDHTIVAKNVRGGGDRDDIQGFVAARYSLVGDITGAAIINNGGNLFGTFFSPVDPLLGPLVDNGGPTFTHKLFDGSPATDAGDPIFVAPPNTDQRGYYRIADGTGGMTARVDIGAYEVASVAPITGDGNFDGMVDGLDYLIWAAHFGDDPALDPPGAPDNGDYNGDGKVDGLDYLAWAGNFGANVAATVASQGAVRNAAIEAEYVANETTDESSELVTFVASDDDTTLVVDTLFEKMFVKKRSHRR